MFTSRHCFFSYITVNYDTIGVACKVYERTEHTVASFEYGMGMC
jgi:hypothetical protein